MLHEAGYVLEVYIGYDTMTLFDRFHCIYDVCGRMFSWYAKT